MKIYKYQRNFKQSKYFNAYVLNNIYNTYNDVFG